MFHSEAIPSIAVPTRRPGQYTICAQDLCPKTENRVHATQTAALLSTISESPRHPPPRRRMQGNWNLRFVQDYLKAMMTHPARMKTRRNVGKTPNSTAGNPPMWTAINVDAVSPNVTAIAASWKKTPPNPLLSAPCTPTQARLEENPRQPSTPEH